MIQLFDSHRLLEHYCPEVSAYCTCHPGCPDEVQLTCSPPPRFCTANSRDSSLWSAVISFHPRGGHFSDFLLTGNSKTPSSSHWHLAGGSKGMHPCAIKLHICSGMTFLPFLSSLSGEHIGSMMVACTTLLDGSIWRLHPLELAFILSGDSTMGS